MPLVVPVAFASLVEPSVGETTVSDGTVTRIPSYSSSVSSGFEVSEGAVVSAAVSTIGDGNALPVDNTLVVGEPAISVAGGLLGSLPGMNSCTEPMTFTELPTAAVAGGALDVKTNTPSDVSEFASMSASGTWIK